MGAAMTLRRAALVALLAGVSMALFAALLATPAHAYSNWAHDGIPPVDTMDNCVWCHANGTSDASCTGLCHRGFMVASTPLIDGRFPQTCWSCHEPGADTSVYSSSSAACTQECHLYSPLGYGYIYPFSHGAEPHLGAEPPYGTCLDCHQTSLGFARPGDSPHHDGADEQAPSCTGCHNGVIAGAQETHDGQDCEACHDGMDLPAVPATCTTCHAAGTFGTQDCRSCHAAQIHDTTPGAGGCTSCHSGYQQHAGALSCTSCHTNAAAFHHGTAAPAVKNCRSCHAMKHAGAKVAASRCADCHKGSAPAAKPRAQHSTSVTKKYVCSGCHSKKLHAKAEGANTTCRTCHKSMYHAKQAAVTVSACTKCHTGAKRHAGGRTCVTCHKSAVHDPTPSA
jgi:hypothetical protein